MSMEVPVVPPIRIETVLSEWRSKTLNSMLIVATILALPTLAAAIIQWMEIHAWAGPIFFSLVYVLLAWATIFRKVDYHTRVWVLLLNSYAAATFALATTGLAGLGRVAFALLPPLAYVMINPRAGWISTALSLGIYLVVGLLSHSGILNSILSVSDNPTDPVTWLMSGATLAMLLLPTQIVLDRFYRLLIRTLHSQQQATIELQQAYNSTLEGWARALELFDRETESHSRNVTDLTLQLASSMGLKTEQLVEVYRGALLHDIGKMGIPEAILFKPGKLDDQERAVMCKHPEYAQQMLAPIDFLRRALDIPYCHHEKWDGTGYPRGLKGEEIPLAARIFSVIDVWEALTSQRRYHEPWPPEKARQYICDRAGKDFDPQVVNAFLNLAIC